MRDPAETVVSLINTLDRPAQDDLLTDERATAWLAEWVGGTPAGGEIREARPDTLARLRDLREGLRQFAAANNGQPTDERAVGRAMAVLRSTPLFVELDHGEQPPRLVPPPDADLAEQAIALAAGCYLAATASGAWSRVKACAAPDCQWTYADSSRNRSRRWCYMSECGNRAKNRTWRQRQKRTGSTPG